MRTLKDTLNDNLTKQYVFQSRVLLGAAAPVAMISASSRVVPPEISLGLGIGTALVGVVLDSIATYEEMRHDALIPAPRILRPVQFSWDLTSLNKNKTQKVK